MGWVEHAIWWHVYPLGMCGAPIREAAAPAPRLRRLLGWLDYAIELGCSGLLLGPIFASQTHGYDSLDLFRIDPRLGSEADFTELVDQAHRRGLRVVLDGVFSHVGDSHPEVLRALREGPGSEAAARFDIDWDAPGGPAPRVFEGHSSLVRFNHSSQATVDYVTSVMQHWLKRGIDGWRLDAAYSVSPDFWAKVTAPVRLAYPEAWLLGEVLHGDYATFVADAGIDSVTQYELWKAIWSSIKDRNLFELDWTLSRNNDLLSSFVPNTFIGNHDVTRIASQVGSDGAVIALVILMTVGGIPSIYYGDEQGFIGVKEERWGGDDDIRPAFPDSPEELSQLGSWLFHIHQDLIGLRRRNPWLVTSTTQMQHLENERCSYRSTAADGSHFLDVEIDLSGTPTASIKDESHIEVWHRSF
ncbi:MAG: alpha-amylase family protein [Propionibacteriaceae bacterium]|nr:alpha-amylase family protein [Propionibacteriaceae bacterium]